MKELPPNGVKPYREALQPLQFSFESARDLLLRHFRWATERQSARSKRYEYIHHSKDDARDWTALP
jgi:hypothetical protein